MAKDSPDWSLPQESVVLGDVVSQLGKFTTYSTVATLAAGAQSTIGYQHNSETTIRRVVGIRWLCMDDVWFSAYLYNTFYGCGFYIIDGFYEIWYPPTVNWILSEGDTISSAITNRGAGTHDFRFIISMMEYIKPVGWIHKPDAHYTVDDLTPAVGQVVTFTDDSEYSPTSWSWNFGDGSYGYGPVVTHAYAAPGTYRAYLFSHNAGGDDYYALSIVVT
jgi:PKD repeat protein